MKILSIDWDYFFPDSMPYDWGHSESMFHLEAIWPLRLSSVNILTGQEAFSEYAPTIPRNFWKRVVKNNPAIYLAESHATIAGMPMGNAIITNLDAHHDCGYKPNPDLDCGNWADYLGKKIKEYHLCYPEWRKDDTEGPKRFLKRRAYCHERK